MEEERIISASTSKILLTYFSDTEHFDHCHVTTELDDGLRYVGEVKLHSMMLPKTWFNVSTTLQNNLFHFTESGGGGDSDFTIPDGYYDETTLAAEITTLINAFALDTWAVTADADTNFFSIENTSGVRIGTLTAVGYASTHGRILVGIEETFIPGNGFVQWTAGGPQLFNTQYDLFPVKYITISLIGCPSLSKLANKNHQAQFTLPVVGNYGDIILYNDKGGYLNGFQTPANFLDFQRMTIYITDQYGRALRMFNSDWTMVLGLRHNEDSRSSQTIAGRKRFIKDIYDKYSNINN